ncbi:hypothetical protein P3X46_014499 [Hevea brasiliensis]|uniref:2-amino-4-hydroxy-6-hydroxymethyldihydropteridine diphosphokinase n=1 Tax=Hevea brasiliensis TaxID=3981 RepID=A0ABQ9MAL1_HEVBR|nr:hypothetical protein P3X46_014499 [Hevea brasiliensis]
MSLFKRLMPTKQVLVDTVKHFRGSSLCFLHSAPDGHVELHSQEQEVVIALGCNVGNRLHNFNQALHLMKKSGITITRHGCLYETAPANVTDQPHFLNSVVRAVTKLGPHELLGVLEKIERDIGCTDGIRYGPRPIDLDILFYGKIWERPFVMAPLMDLLGLDVENDTVAYWHSLSIHSGGLFESWEKLGGEYLIGKEEMKRVLLVGNHLWFTDGGKFQSVDSVVSHVRLMISEGADIIDFDAQSPRPMIPEMNGKLISVDTFYSEVSVEAVRKGAQLINDVSGAGGQLDPNTTKVVAGLEVPYVAMHMRGDSTTMQNSESLQYDNIKDAELSGVLAWRIIIDPGIGFSKNSKHNLDILNGLPTIRAVIARKSLAMSHAPILIGPSRKRFLGEICARPAAIERDPATIASITAGILGGANIVRVHNVSLRDNLDAAKQCDAMLKRKSSAS